MLIQITEYFGWLWVSMAIACVLMGEGPGLRYLGSGSRVLFEQNFACSHMLSDAHFDTLYRVK